ncbi:hypothetical protein [Demequina globuliformis]|uniref:hypothetical protein n=1 Tax=Demequina globuliformis TaxID=676202 RepID=UPI000783F68E|nr:hypothetical protein [Demequina globuliformis]
MTRYAIDAAVALEIAAGSLRVHEAHSLVGPGRLRSDAMAILFAAVRAGSLEADQGLAQLDALATVKMRLLNDRVSRAVAWTIAAARARDGLGATAGVPVSEYLGAAEYFAVASLQADALIALDPTLTAGAVGLVELAPVEALARA